MSAQFRGVGPFKLLDDEIEIIGMNNREVKYKYKYSYVNR